MTRPELLATVDHACAKTAVRVVDDVARIYGHHGWIEPLDDGTFDVFIHNTADIAKGLGTLKLKNLLAAADDALQGRMPPVTRLDGEAYFTVDSVEDVKALFPVLRVRNARRLSASTKADLAARLARYRAAA